MKSRYKGANKSKSSLFKKLLIASVVLGIFIFSERYVSRDNSEVITETDNIIVKSPN
jgi:hypothetical protein